MFALGATLYELALSAPLPSSELRFVHMFLWVQRPFDTHVSPMLLSHYSCSLAHQSQFTSMRRWAQLPGDPKGQAAAADELFSSIPEHAESPHAPCADRAADTCEGAVVATLAQSRCL